MKNLILLLVLAFLAGACGNQSDGEAEKTETTENPEAVKEEVDYTDPEAFGTEVFDALKANDYSRMSKFLPTGEDIQYLIDQALNANPDMSDAEINKMKSEIKGFHKKRIAEAKTEFENARQKIIDKGIAIEDATLNKIEFTQRKKGPFYSGNVFVYFDYLGAEYMLDLDDCLKVERSWLIGDDIRLDGEYN